MKQVIIIGGGISGLSSAVLLSSLGYKVKIIESRRFPGGRMYSFKDKETGEILDNGQHLLMGCYKYTFKFFKHIGTLEKMLFQDKLRTKFINHAKNEFTLTTSNLPTPYHIFWGLIKSGVLSFKQAFNLIKLSNNIHNSIIFHYKSNHTVKEFLQNMNQKSEIISNFWNPITISTMNGEPENISADLFKKVIYEIFFKSAWNSVLSFPKLGLSQMYIDNSLELIKINGGEILFNSEVTDFIIEGKNISGIKLKNGSVITGDVFISSIPYYQLLKYPRLITKAGIRDIYDMASSPIISIYLWTEKEFTTEKITNLLGMNSQVLFNLSRIRTDLKNKQLFCIVISAANKLINLSKKSILELVINELKYVYGIENVNIMHSKIIKERNATLLITPSVEKIRPDQKTKIDNFYLIGDWVNTGLPATIESAIKSSYKITDYLS